MGPLAIWLAVRSALARTWVGAASVAVLLGAVGGIVSSALWGAERVETSYERLVNEVAGGIPATPSQAGQRPGDGFRVGAS